MFTFTLGELTENKITVFFAEGHHLIEEKRISHW